MGPTTARFHAALTERDVRGTTRQLEPTQLRDVSSAQPRLPIEPTTWNNWRFMLRARRVRVEGPKKLKLKLFYLAIAGFTDQLLKGVDVGKFALPIRVILHDLQLSENTFYRLRRELHALGLLEWKQRRNRSTEYRVFARREWAAAAPDSDHPQTARVAVRQPFTNRTGCGSSTAKVADLCSSLLDLSNSTAAAAVVPAVQDRQQRRIDGMIVSCEISARILGRDFDRTDHRERLRTGELSIDRMQEFTNELKAERDERKRRARL